MNETRNEKPKRGFPLGRGSLIAVVCIGGTLAFNRLVPSNYLIEQKNGSDGMYDSKGDFYIREDPKNMLRYLTHENPDALRSAIYDIGREMNYERPRKLVE